MARPELGMPDARFDGHSRAPAFGRRAFKKGDDALGRSRGGMSTKVPLAVDAEDRPVELSLTLGQEHDLHQAFRLLADHEPVDVIADNSVRR